ncbi:unnamed protein product [Protopolystoma xenopodis]|uniref:Uncharacterized protein n=1 Tax=Protopolystoma xenopodis TaxID=117903 RepID=A0A448WPA5_9PLAT|nr:unnamed protein product [Protopolystoma xenopodis]
MEMGYMKIIEHLGGSFKWCPAGLRIKTAMRVRRRYESLSDALIWQQKRAPTFAKDGLCERQGSGGKMCDAGPLAWLFTCEKACGKPGVSTWTIVKLRRDGIVDGSLNGGG